jgi:drug/metabolite transporter (DMT)-like permease
MSARLASFLVVVVSLAGYHIAQRSMPEWAKPAPLFAFVYATATLLMIGVLTLARAAGSDVFGRVGDIARVAGTWSPWLLVAAVSGIELGIFFMYRSGWGVTSASTSTQAVAAAVLVVVGVLVFREHISPTKLIGLAMCVVGAGLVSR